MTTTAPRAPIDFDAFEREVRQPAQPQPAAASNRADPLAELARIVGQDDPFRTLLQNNQDQARPAAGRRTEPTFADEPAARHAPEAPISPADAFDQYLATVEQGAYAHERDGGTQDAAFDSDPDAFPPPAPRRSNRRYLQVGAGIGVLVLCVTGALGWKSLSAHSGNGEPVTVLADKSPLKEAPPATDGVEIPDQNKQIYDRNAKDGQIKIVNREEQPIDVNQAIRSNARDSAGQGGATPGSGGMLTDSLGEPRRVRTVSVKPDTPPPSMQQHREAQAEVARPRISPIPTMMMPEASDNSATAAPVRSSRTLPTRSVSADVASAAAPPATSDPVPSKPTTQRVAAVAPETTASTTEPSAAATASVGGFSVQLGVRSSESDAHAAFRQMQSKYSQLSGKPELIRQAEVDGKSIYRVRVGPLGKSEANTLCTQLKGAGGQCFVAKN